MYFSKLILGKFLDLVLALFEGFYKEAGISARFLAVYQHLKPKGMIKNIGYLLSRKLEG